MDDPRFVLEVVGAVVLIAGLLWRGGEIKGAIEKSLEQNARDHAALAQNQDSLWKHQRAQDELISEHGLDIAAIKERIKSVVRA